MATTSSDLLKKAQAHYDNVENPHKVKSDQIYGLWNVENTSDKDKPVSTALQSALDEKFNISDIYNKLTDDGTVTDLSTVPLSAQAGKVLSDTINAMSDIDGEITSLGERITALEEQLIDAA